MQADRRLKRLAYVQFVMGVKNAVPADRDVFDYYTRTVEQLLPRSEWCAAGIGRHQIKVNKWGVAAGGNARTGLEDNICMNREPLAPSNVALWNAWSRSAKVIDAPSPHQPRPGIFCC